ncbi:Fur family transcriptional regulator [Fibrobacter sp. UWB12]|uniref:Fur family transcriptional regulator n=1 Tax=Fibrobacter sp. UWB12 TaxID=1896203 RepID=UPI0009130951|nr:transcriptional repressor [Fibrobacter sp. UWB12]SHK24608.1 Fur family transcriptional regulator, ferric uptake regulator [Fibrobacter sp. UWB12]
MGVIKYKTKQQELLLSCFKAMQGRHFTAEDVSAYFQKKNISIGIATIYRQIEKFVAMGVVQKYFLGEQNAACFQYMGEECHKEVSHFHLKCEKCGTLIHLECHDLEQLSSHLMAEHGFALDPFRTVFYGLCENCRLAG